jgi:general secretion pathway protein K
MRALANRRERGYAMLAAVGAVACFGYLALAAIGDGRSALVGANAGEARARLAAAADAGVAMTIHDLGLADPRRRWSLTDPPHSLDFGDARLTVAIEDENGKIPINFMRPDQMRRLFEEAGADPRQIDGLVEALVDLRGDPQPGGFIHSDPRLAAQRGPLTNLDELQLLPGMTPALYARIAPSVTVHAVTLAFDPRTASPLALAVMAPSYASSPGAIEQARERAGETAALASPAPISLNGRMLTIHVEASDGQGGRLTRTAVVEFTGAAGRPYVMRGVE